MLLRPDNPRRVLVHWAPWACQAFSAFEVSLNARTHGPNETGEGLTLSDWQAGYSILRPEGTGT